MKMEMEMEMKAESERNPLENAMEKETEVEGIIGMRMPKLKFSPDCSVCSIEDKELLYKIHYWKFTEKKSYKEIVALVKPVFLTVDKLEKHFKRHFPVAKTGSVEVISSDSKLKTYYHEQVEERVKPVLEMEKLYEKLVDWMELWESKQVKDDVKTIKNSDVEPLVRLSGELKTILVELNKMRQTEAMAKVCVQGFMTRFVKILLGGLDDEMENLLGDLKIKYKDDERDLRDVMQKSKSGLAHQIKDGAREALIATVQEYGLRG